ncbi:DoxX family protein [Polyangium jinanense]|uniref:DoxX family protein n=1 Tax=Polyangium jinanense TaxID=2829994 RepID=A0A9X3XBD3_9BACT|nr:DoxX family protein [Polyangium jinanense]MDC3987137.1 DoxX family protein [Polyangium jinanense]
MTNPEHRISHLLDRSRDAGLLVLRVGAALLIWAFHMRPKLAHFDEELRSFPDPIGIGHAPSFLLALVSEGLCSVLCALGLLTRLSALPIVFTMAMVLLLAVRGFEGADVQAALLYALPYLTLALVGPGRHSIDHLLRHRYEALLRRYLHRAPSQGA